MDDEELMERKKHQEQVEKCSVFSSVVSEKVDVFLSTRPPKDLQLMAAEKFWNS